MTISIETKSLSYTDLLDMIDSHVGYNLEFSKKSALTYKTVEPTSSSTRTVISGIVTGVDVFDGDDNTDVICSFSVYVYNDDTFVIRGDVSVICEGNIKDLNELPVRQVDNYITSQVFDILIETLNEECEDIKHFGKWAQKLRDRLNKVSE